MPITNLNNVHFTTAEINEARLIAARLFAIVNTKTRNLTAEERKEYGSINEQNKLVALKVLDYASNQPTLRSPDVDYVELTADWDDRSFLAGIMDTLGNIIKVADNIRITHDWDAYQASKQDYRHAEYRGKTDGGAAFEEKYNTLKDFFTTNTGGGTSPDGGTPTPPADPK